MKWPMGKVLNIFTCIVTLGAIYFNWSEFFMGNYATNYNFLVSTGFILWWLFFSFYWGIQKEIKYIKFILIYWSLNIVSFALIWLKTSKGNTYSSILLPFSIWYGSPLYGFKYLLGSDISNLVLITAPLGLIISVIGYCIGLMVSKIKKTTNFRSTN